MARTRVNNGTRELLTLPFVEVVAGAQVDERGIMVAYPGPITPKDAVGQVGTLGARRVAVARVDASSNPGMRRLILREIA